MRFDGVRQPKRAPAKPVRGSWLRAVGLRSVARARYGEPGGHVGLRRHNAGDVRSRRIGLTARGSCAGAPTMLAAPGVSSSVGADMP